MKKRLTWNEWYFLALNSGYPFNERKKTNKLNYNRNMSKIGAWISRQRSAYFNNKLNSNQIKLLEKAGIDWNLGIRFNNQVTWDNAYLLALVYYKENGNLLIPPNYIVDGYNLGSWIIRQRVAYKGYYLKKEYIDRLNSIRMIWDKKENINMLKIICNKYQINFENNLPNINYLPYALFEHIINVCIDNNIAYIDSNGKIIDKFYIDDIDISFDNKSKTLIK